MVHSPVAASSMAMPPMTMAPGMTMSPAMPPMDMDMKMYFHWSNTAYILFHGWHVTNAGDFLVSCIALIVLCIFRELVIYIQQRHELVALYGELPYWPTTKSLDAYSQIRSSSARLTPQKSDEQALTPLNATVIAMERGSVTLQLRLFDALMYSMSLTLGYLLMLVVMTFNTGLILAVILGFVIGRLMFGYQIKILRNFVRFEQQTNSVVMTDPVLAADSNFVGADHCGVRT